MRSFHPLRIPKSFLKKFRIFSKKGLTKLKQCGIIEKHSEIMNVRYRGMEQLGSSSGS